MATKTKKSKLELTPYPQAKCWKKYRAGVVYYVGKNVPLDWSKANAGTSPESDAYRAALAEWNELLAKLKYDELIGIDTSTKHYQTELREWRKLPDAARTPTLPPHLQAALTVPRPAGLSAKVPAGPFHVPAGFDAQAGIENAVSAYVAPPAGAVPAATGTVPTEIGPLIEKYLGNMLANVKGEQYGETHYARYYEKLGYFREFCEATELTDIRQINAEVLEEFRKAQLHFMTAPDDAKGKIAWDTAKQRLDCLKTFMLYCERIGAAPPLPRYLMEEFAKIKKPKNGKKKNGNLTFKPDEIRELWELATDRMKLYLALALNCGFTQVDISTLEWEHYDRETGTIDRRRNKTKNRENPVKQVFKLWPETRELLERFAEPETSVLMLRSESGGELLTHKIVNGKPMKTDAIRLAFNRLKKQWAWNRLAVDHPTLFTLKRTGIEGELTGDEWLAIKAERAEQRKPLLKQWLAAEVRTFKILRKTSADLLEQSDEYGELASLFLAHADGATKRFYTNPPYHKLEPAVEHLREIYGLKL